MGSLSENIRRLRFQRGLNQVMLAEKMNVTKQCVSNWENDNVLPSIEALLRLADLFGVSTDFLLGRESQASLDISGLTEEQVTHVALLVSDLQKLNKKQ